MIGLIQEAAFTFLTNQFADYGISSNFRYDPDLDVLNEFRKSIRLRVQEKSTYDEIVNELTGEGPLSGTLGLFSRSPINKSELFGNNVQLQHWVREYNSVSNIQLRNCFEGTVTFNVKMLFDNSDSADAVELIYLNHLANEHRSFSVTYDTGEDHEPIEDVKYNIYLEQISDLGALNSSTLRYMDFSFRVEGLTFLPFTRDSGLLEKIELRMHIFNRKQEISPENANDSNLVYENTIVIDRGIVEKPN